MTKLSDMPEIFTTNHTAQVRWLDNQIKKNNGSIFLNQSKAMAAYTKLLNDCMGIYDGNDIEKYTARYLSADGIKKLTTTLRVAETRSKKSGFKLQCNIDYSNNDKLERLMKLTGMKKGDVINKLIELAHVEKITKTEQQLELTM